MIYTSEDVYNVLASFAFTLEGEASKGNDLLEQGACLVLAGVNQELNGSVAPVITLTNIKATLVIDAAHVTSNEAAALRGEDDSTWRRRCIAGQVKGAVKQGKTWLIPQNQV